MKQREKWVEHYKRGGVACNICNRYVWPFYTLVNEVIDNKPNQIKALTEYSASIYINPEFLITIFTLGVELL